MGGSQSSEKKLEIINDTRVQSALKNVNENINEMTMNIMQENLQKTAASAKVKQEVSIEGVKAEGDITISGVKQKAQVQISVSSLTNAELQQELITETMNELQTKMTENMKLSQEQAQKQGEQMIAELAGAFSGAIASATGTDVNEKSDTSIQNLLNIKSDTELQNIVKQAVSSDLVNRTVNEVANNIVGEQKVAIKDAESGGSIAIANVEQDVLSTQMLEAISSVGTGAEIVSKIANVRKVEVEKAKEAGQKAVVEEEGTLSAAGGFVESAVGAWTNFVQTGALTVLIPILVIGAIVLFMFRGVISQVAAKQGGVEYIPEGQFAQPMMTGGSKAMKNVFKPLIKMIKSFRKSSMKFAKKHFTTKNLIKAIIIMVALSSVYALYRKIRYNRVMEGFSNESKLDNLIISNDMKYVTNKKLGDTDICLNSDKSKAFKFDVSIINDKDIYIVRMVGEDKFYLKAENDKIIIEKYDMVNDSSYKFQFDKKGENKYILKQGEKYIGINEECLNITSEKDKAITLTFE